MVALNRQQRRIEALNRQQRRIEAGVNKRGLHKPKVGRKMILVYGKNKLHHFLQPITQKNGRIKFIKHTLPA